VKWNATSFGTNYMFLESFMRRNDKFMVWFMSPEFRHSSYFLTEMERYAFDNITNVEWWENMQYVLDEVEPLYVFLTFVDRGKSPTLGEVHMQYTNTKHTYQSKFENDSARYNMIMDVVDARMNMSHPSFKEQSRVHLIHAPKKTTYIITERIEINVIKHQSIYYIAEDLIQNKRINIQRTKDRRRQCQLRNAT
jgi:hypothetical protein